MHKLKFLFITKDWKNGIEKNTVYLARQLKTLTQYMEWHEPGDISEIIKQLPAGPDFILLNDLRPTRCPEITGLKNIDIPLGIIMHDLNHYPEKRKAFIEDNNIRYLFVHYRNAFLKKFPEFKDRMIWFPHYINTEVFKDYGLNKTCTYLMMGCIEPVNYPLRVRMLETMKSMDGFVCHPHPGYFKPAYPESEYIVGQRYAREINRAKIFLTDDSIYHYTLMKYFEVPACNTLLLAPASGETADLGFIPSVNYVSVNENNFLESAKYYADNYDAEGSAIAQRGFELVRSRHTVVHRARQLVAKAEEIVNGYEGEVWTKSLTCCTWGI